MIKIRLIGYHFHNCPDFYVNRPNGSGDYLLLYLRSPTEIMTDNKCIRVPKNTFKKINHRFTDIFNPVPLMTTL